MKRITAVLLLVVMLFALCACGEKGGSDKKDATLVGSWVSEDISDAIYTFNEDGSGDYEYFGTKMKFTYEDDGKAVTLKYENATEENVFTNPIKGDKLEIEDSFGDKVIYIKK